MTTPRTFRKKPVEIEAVWWDGTRDGATGVINWITIGGGTATYRCDGPDGCLGTEGSHYVVVRTLEGDMLASPGDWIIRGVQNEHYPCKPEVFVATYDEVADQ